MLDTLKTMVGGASRTRLDAPPAVGDAGAVVATLIAAVKRSIPVKPREGCTAVYLEAIVANTDLEACVGLLTGVLGTPAKPFGRASSFDRSLIAMIDSRGGIQADQCLYLRRYADGRVAFAALWPWRSGIEITLKLGVYDDDVTPGLDA